ncbi:MAG: hypothetical protein HKM05_05130 [Spirochaetales bacterium]|nr:hypothetical protein [Spirochaetales bacterium]
MSNDFDDSCNPRGCAGRMIKKCQVTRGHVIAHKVSGLVVAYAKPPHPLAGGLSQVIDRHFARF